MFKQALSNLMIGMILSVTTTAHAGMNNQNKTIVQIVEQYDYQMTAGPNAGNPEEVKKMMAEMEAEVAKASKGASVESLKAQADALIAQIPDEDKREKFKNKLRFASKEELKSMVANPELMAAALHGEGSNFTFDNGLEAIGYVLIAALAVGIVLTIVDDLNHDEYESFVVTYAIYSGEICSSKYVSSSERERMKADAMYVCKTKAAKSETCRSAGFIATESFDYNYYGEIQNGYCNVRAVAKADK